ncbi:heparan-alpha-glucosaminide N-acetyltransferase [Entomortierella parvispora]|uniref:Heparan-alpha-glucosaminide N-acetyltransferase n=1 Tax=Entomortierella parvispora TaxID=205924 RepID=A0A9P3HFV9_9FUNG|nr:heparan-alpha-glucosaminide N-acetyltransferase [Entomortierella parvispora]
MFSLGQSKDPQTIHAAINTRPPSSSAPPWATTELPSSCRSCSSSCSVPPTFAPGRLDLTLHRRRGSAASDSSSSSSSCSPSHSLKASAISNPASVNAATAIAAAFSPGNDPTNVVCSCSLPATDAPSDLQQVRIIENTPRAASSSFSSTLSTSLRSASISPRDDSTCKVHLRPRLYSSPDMNGQQRSSTSGSHVTTDSTLLPATSNSTTITSANPTSSKPKRLQSLDLLRGVSIVLMVLVNTQGADPFVQLAHSEWFGYTLADWVFPNFIFMVGVALALVFNPKRLRTLSDQSHDNSTCGPSLFRLCPPWIQRHNKRLEASAKILKRSLLLFSLGIALALLELIGLPRNGLWLRIPGVLQRIAFCYLVLALTVLWTEVNQKPPPTLRRSAFESWQLPFVCTALWLVLTFAVKSTATEAITGCRYPASAYSPTGLVLSGHAPSRGQLSPPQCTAQAFLDTVLFTLDRDTNNPIVDAEGTVGSLMAIVSGWFGWVMGRVLLLQQQQSARTTAGKDIKESERPQSESFSAQCLDASGNNVGAVDAFNDQTRMLRACSFHPPAGTTTDVTQTWVDAKKSDASWDSEAPQGIGMTQTTLEHLHYMTMDEQDEDRKSDQRRMNMLAHMTEWFMAGICVTLLGTILDWVLPICKGLWTPSFTLVSAGFSILALCALLYLFDLPTSKLPQKAITLSSASMMTSPGWRASLRCHCWTFWQLMTNLWGILGQNGTHLLICYGRNSTLIFMLTESVKIILEKIPVHTDLNWIQSVWSFIFFKSFIRFMPPPWASLVFSLVYVLFFAPLMWYLDSRAIYLRV